MKGKTEIIFDSGVRSGLDIIRAIALGADFVMAGRPFLYGAAALGKAGAKHAIEIFRADLVAKTLQIGAKNIADIRRTKFNRGLS
ncbi:MAG: alpha-hydroxy-acid oxidizing protein [Salaquimonas sp.]